MTMTNFDEYINELSRLSPIDICSSEKQELLKRAFDNNWNTDIALELIQQCWITPWEDGDNDCTIDQVLESFERVYGTR